MRYGISLFVILLFVTGCPGTTGPGGGQGSGEGAGQGDAPQDVTDPGDSNSPDDGTNPDDIGDLTDEVPPGADTYVAMISGTPDDWSILVSLGTDGVVIEAFEVDSGVYTIRLDRATTAGVTVEAKGGVPGDQIDDLPLVPDTENVTIDVTAVVDKLDPQSPSFLLLVVFTEE